MLRIANPLSSSTNLKPRCWLSRITKGRLSPPNSTAGSSCSKRCEAIKPKAMAFSSASSHSSRFQYLLIDIWYKDIYIYYYIYIILYKGTTFNSIIGPIGNSNISWSIIIFTIEIAILGHTPNFETNWTYRVGWTSDYQMGFGQTEFRSPKMDPKMDEKHLLPIHQTPNDLQNWNVDGSTSINWVI